MPREEDQAPSTSERQQELEAGLSTGYHAGFRKGEDRSPFTSRVHAYRSGKAICGYRPSVKAQFQWCAWGIVQGYLTCPRCIDAAKRMEPAAEAEPRIDGPSKARQAARTAKATRFKVVIPAGSDASTIRQTLSEKLGGRVLVAPLPGPTHS